MERFRAARDLLLRHREDYERASAEFRALGAARGDRMILMLGNRVEL